MADAPKLSIEMGLNEGAWAWVACLRPSPWEATALYTFKNQDCIEELGRLMEANDGNALQNALPNIFEGNNPTADIHNQLFEVPEVISTSGGRSEYRSKRGKIANTFVDAGKFLQGKALSQGE